MQFESARPDIVRAIAQRWLLKFWTEARGARALPLWHEMEASEFAAMSASLSFADVVTDGGHRRFLIRYHGAGIGEAYGSDCRGRYLDEILPERYREAALAGWRQVVETAAPVYTTNDIPDRDGRIVHYERLLLPFGRNGSTVDRVLASLEMISADGAFTRRDLMKNSGIGTAFSICATIQPSAGSTRLSD